jgi:hypothetical protein
MYLDYKVKIPDSSSGITRKKSRVLHIFITLMDAITMPKRNIQYRRIRP